MKEHRDITILIDLDQIVVELVPEWLKQYETITGESVSEKKMDDYNFEKYVKDKGVLYDILAKDGFFSNLPPIKGAVIYIGQLIEDGYDVVFVTQPPRRSKTAVANKREWIAKYFPSFDLTNIIFAHRKELVKGDILVDDRPSHLKEWSKNNPGKITATISYPYNSKCSANWKFDKEEFWESFYKKVKNFHSCF